MKKIFVGNFSFSLSEDELRSLFAPFGTVDSATVVTDRATGRSRGFGFVEMPNNDEAEKAITALNGKDSGGRALTVRRRWQGRLFRTCPPASRTALVTDPTAQHA